MKNLKISSSVETYVTTYTKECHIVMSKIASIVRAFLEADTGNDLTSIYVDMYKPVLEVFAIEWSESEYRIMWRLWRATAILRAPTGIMRRLTMQKDRII